jgi:CheY-like chemotaxis protein
MDLRMPHLDGFAATRQIRRHCCRADSTISDRRPWIIAVTANSQPADRDAACASGINDVLTKPVHLADLSQALHRAHLGQQGRAEEPSR